MSRDGKSIYFESKGDIWKKPAGGGGIPERITRKGGSNFKETFDGRFFYYLKGDPEIAGLWKVSMDGGEESQVLKSVCRLNFAVVDKGIYLIPSFDSSLNEESFPVQFFSFATEKVGTIAEIRGQPAYGFSVSPDCRWLLYAQYEPFGGDLWMVENFR